jgi:hypothetical protein
VAATQLYVGASTPFGVVTWVSNDVYNAQALVRAKNGTVSTYRLPFLLALGLRLPERMTA